MPAVYLILGLPGSGRREIILDLMEGGLPEAHPVTIYQAASDALPAGDTAAALVARPGVTTVSHTFANGQFSFDSGSEPETPPETIFFIADGRTSAIDQLEVFPALLQAQGWTLARILVVVHCALAAAHAEVAAWYEAAIHFADVVLLNRREGDLNAWVQEFRKKFAAEHYPCLFAMVKKGHVDNALLVLFPEPRRLSLIFDDIDPIDELDLDEENLPDEPFNLERKPDPYFERQPNGQRRKLVPAVTAFLPK